MMRRAPSLLAISIRPQYHRLCSLRLHSKQGLAFLLETRDWVGEVPLASETRMVVKLLAEHEHVPVGIDDLEFQVAIRLLRQFHFDRGRLAN